MVLDSSFFSASLLRLGYSRYVQRDKKIPLIHEKHTKNGHFDQPSTIMRPIRDRTSGAFRSTLAQWLDGVCLMAKVAALKITTSGKKVRVSCGKFSDSFLPSVWAQTILDSVHQPFLLNPDEQAESKRIFLYRGLGFRISPHDTVGHLEQAILENEQPPPPPAPSFQPNPSFGYIQERSHHSSPPSTQPAFVQPMFYNMSNDTMAKIFLSLAEQRSRSREGDESYILRIATNEAMEIAIRCVSRNILNTKISRYIPQDVKIAVAIRDHGQCTYTDMYGRRCPAKTDLQYDHRFWPFSLGGTQSTWNLTLKCGEHNREESDNIDIPKALQEAMGVFLRW